MKFDQEISAFVPRPTTQLREVYFVQACTIGLVKIGVADNAAKRVRELALASPDRLRVLGALPCANFGKTEEELHEKFKRERRHGEWFVPTQRLLDHITSFAWNPARVTILQAACDRPTIPKGRYERTKVEHN